MTIACNGPRQSRQRSAICLAVAAAALLVSACAAPAPKTELGTIFYPPVPELPRLQFLTTINAEKDIGGGDSAFTQFLVGAPKSQRRLRGPYAVAHEKDKIYVVDKGLPGIVVIDLAQKKFDLIRDTKGGPLRDPFGISVTKDGYKFVADKGRGQIVVYNQRNEFHRAYGAEKQFVPVAVAAGRDRVYVSDTGEHEVEILDRQTGEVIKKIGGIGGEIGQFTWPTHMTLDSEGNLYVTDFLNNRVQKFDKDGNFLKQFGRLGDFPGAMPRPKGLAVDRDGYLYVVDVAFELVQIFDGKTAEVLLGFGKFGPAPGGTWLPNGIDIDYDNVEYFSQYVDKNFRAKYLVYVANQAGPNKLNVYAFGDWIGPPPAGARSTGAPES